MKKLYSMFIASAVAFSITASAGGDGARLHTGTPVRTIKSIDVPAWPANASLAPVNKNFKGLRKADGQPSIEGWWTVYLGDYYDLEVATGGIIPVSYNAVADGNKITFTPIVDEISDGHYYYKFIGIYDSENLTLTISKEYIGIEIGRFVFQMPFEFKEYTDEDGKVVEGPVTIDQIQATFNPDEYLLEFEPDQGIEWGGFKDSMGEDYEGYMAMYDLVKGYEFNTVASMEGEWEAIGSVTFTDPWLVPSMGPSFASQNGYPVQFEQRKDKPTMFRLVKPYQTGPVTPYNGFRGDSYIVFDIADPKHVLFLPCDAGFSNLIAGINITSFYCYNALGYMAVNQPALDVDELVELFDYIPFTEYKDNMVILGSVTGNGEVAYDANFGYQDSPFGGNFWQGVKMEGSIAFPDWFNAEVGKIAVDDSANVEYYNLNGVRLNNPEKGQIVIKRAGSTVTKEIVK